MKKYIFLLAAAAITLSACDDILDKEPKSQLSPESYFRTATDLQLFTNPLYNNLLPKSIYSEQSDQYINDNPSNLIRGGTFRTVPASGGGWTWTDLRRINTCLDYIPKQCEDPAAAVQYTALCKFFRAYLYFDKVQRFGDVPWVDHELGSNDPVLYKARDSREVVMTHMIEDIDEAIAGLPESYGSGNYRVTKWAALALKSRFCLYEGTYRKYHGIKIEGANTNEYYLQLAADAAKRLMDEGPFSLYSTGNPNLDYAVLFSEYDANTTEDILSINFDNGTALYHNATAVAVMSSQGRLSLTKKFVNLYLMRDGSRFTDQEGWKTMQFAEETANRDPRLAQTIRIPGYSRITEDGGKYSYSTKKSGVDAKVTLTGYQMAKFVMPDNNASADKFDKSYNDIALFRYAEVLLNYAEAKAELGTLTADDWSLTIGALRRRAGITGGDLDNLPTVADPYLMEINPGITDPVLLEIRRERAVELAQEGLRYDDLMRWKYGDMIAEPYYGVYFPGPGVYDIDGDGTNDYYIYSGSKDKSVTATVSGELGKDFILSEGDHGYMQVHPDLKFSFDPNRDYLYPVPIDDRTLNPNLTQNPGWNDGLDY
ncbi:MAG: RagB/SusD family nutrient uptake outer membrane protein [Bacteroidales bacterium]|nr:RagB/SusD family nutrient uptake outer membrane protein [Bacteroidales bacterium]